MSQGPFLRKYGVQTTIDFHLFEINGIDLRKDAAVVVGDLFVMKDEGVEAAATNGATDEGRGYSLVLTATEMQASRVVVYIEDQTATKVWLDTAVVIETYGNASAQHTFDLDVATQNVNIDSTNNIALSAQQKLDVNAECDTAIADAALATAASLTTVDTVVDGIQADLSNATDGLGAIKTSVDAIPTTAMRGTDGVPTNPALASVCTEARLSELDTGTTGKLANDVENRLPTALVSGRMDSDVGAISQSTAAADNLEASASVIIKGSATATTLSTTQMSADGFTEATSSHFNGRIIIWTSGALLGQATDITAYVGGTQTFAFTAVTEAPADNDTFVIV